MIVVDTNVVAYLLIHGQRSQRAAELRGRDKDWRVPALFLHEWLNVVTQHVRHGTLDRDEAIRIFKRGTSIVTVEQWPLDPVEIINLHLASGCSSYDCQFISLAQRLKTELHTADAEVLRAFGSLAIEV